MSEARIKALEEALAHQIAVTDDLSAVIAEQAKTLDQLQSRIALLMKRAAEQEAGTEGGAFFADETPPHW